MKFKRPRTKSVLFYKRLILIAAGIVIAAPTIALVILAVQNGTLRKQLDSFMLPPDDAVTVGATQLEPAGSAREKPVFLTFDDSPSEGTKDLLDTLKKRGVEATFFVNGKSNRLLTDQLKRIAGDGHSIGMHSYSHRYNIIYENMENFLDDFYRNFLYIKSETGKVPEILRFPGGSINIFNISTYQSMVAEVLRRGFIYYDWNVSAGDAIAGATTQSIIENVINGVHLCWGPAIVLMHDNGKLALRDALGPIVDTLAKEGYEFRKLDNSIKPPMFIYPD